MSIRFHSDWKNADGRWIAIPHLTTKNKSFLRTCGLLKKMGIKNYAFPLALYDPDLADVDVHGLEDNTPENEILRIKVQVEARRNGWYFLRECIRIYEQGGSPVSFRLDRGSCAMAWCFLNGLDYCGMQPRQTGKEQPHYSLIKTPSGWVTMGNIRVGDIALTPDGGTATVLQLYPQGIKPIYRVTLEDGQYTDCGDEHLWNVYCEAWGEEEWRVITTSEIRDTPGTIYFPVFDSHTHDCNAVKVVSIEYVGEHEAQCIEIDHPDHLYITDNDIVTHNTVCALSLTAWVLYSSGEEFQIGMMAKDNSLRTENVKRVKSFGENLPKWWLSEDKYKDKKNAEEIYYNAFRTHYVTFVGQSEKSAADKQARGASPPMFHFDEFEFTSNVGISYPTILASTGTARENAKKNGKPHSNIITTTAGDPTKPECREAAKILSGAMAFNEGLYDLADNKSLHEIVEASSPQKMIFGAFSHLQLGYTNQWLRDKINRNRMTRDQVMRDYLNQRVSIAEEPIIPEDTLKTINSSQCETSWLQVMSSKFVIYWYISKEVVESQAFKDRPIIVGCDSSEMIDNDATTLVGICPRSLETVFTFRCSEGNINSAGVMIAQMLLQFPKMVWVPENKSSGTSLIDVVSLILRKNHHNPFTRVFNWVVQRREEEQFATIDIRDANLLDTSVKKHFGIKTDANKRNQLFSDVLLEAAERAASKIKDRVLIQELNSLTVRNGRVDHAIGGHDDTVVAWLMAMWFILNGKHLDIYGIRPGTIMSVVAPNSQDKTRLSEYHQAMVREKIEALEKAHKTQQDPGLKRFIESEITLMKSFIEKSLVPLPQTADELHRDPNKFTDQDIARASKPQVYQPEMERTMRMMMGIR